MEIRVYDANYRLSRHFRLWEAVVSETAARHGIDNTPGPTQIQHLEWTARSLVDPVRDRFGAIRVTSAFRCPELNVLVKSDSRSAHPDGRAFDFQPYDPDVSLAEIVDWVAASELPFDQLIYEYGAWVHLGAPRRCDPRRARRQVLMKFRGTRYLPYDPTDSRVLRPPVE